MLNIGIVGNPNSGKTTLFNNITGSTAHVGNWPGVTVDKKEGIYKRGKEKILVTDLPGNYSLSPYTDEEVITRNFILHSKPDCIINIVDVTNLERNLYLTTQIMELGVPMVLAVNMMDLAERENIKISIPNLEKDLGIRAVEICALKGSGTKELMEVAIEEAGKKREPKSLLKLTKLKGLIDLVESKLEEIGISSPLFHAIKLIEGDEIEVNDHPKLYEEIQEKSKEYQSATFKDDNEGMIADARYQAIEKISKDIFIQKKEKLDIIKQSSKRDKIFTHPVFGIPIFLIIMFLVFHVTFSENFLFLGGLFGDDFVTLSGTSFEGLFGEGGINSPGAMLLTLIETLGDLFMGWFAGVLEGAGAASWLVGFLVDGVFAGLFAVLSFLPQILILYFFLSILEDTGYMARIVFLLDRLFKKMGLSGRALIPMVMGFGCSIPAIMNTRTLNSREEKLATIRVIPFFSCGAKLPILTAIAGAIVMHFGIGNADLITFGMYILGIVTAFIAIVIMSKTTLKGMDSPFIMELPPYRSIKFSSLMIHLWDKMKHFIQKAFTVILASTIAIWAISHFSFGWRFLEDSQLNESILGKFGQLVQPLFTPLGFGSQLNQYGWVFAVAIVTGLIAKENVVATFGTLAAAIIAGFSGDEEGVSSVIQIIGATGITVPALISFIAFNMLTIPCFAAVASAKGELTRKDFNWTILFWFVTSYLVSTIVYVIGTWWWAIFIVLAILASVITIIEINYRKYQKRKVEVTA